MAYHIDRNGAKKIYIQHRIIEPQPATNKHNDHRPTTEHKRCTTQILTSDPDPGGSDDKYWIKRVNNCGQNKHHVVTILRVRGSDLECDIDPSGTAPGETGDGPTASICSCEDETEPNCPAGSIPVNSPHISCVRLIGKKRPPKKSRRPKKGS